MLQVKNYDNNFDYGMVACFEKKDFTFLFCCSSFFLPVHVALLFFKIIIVLQYIHITLHQTRLISRMKSKYNFFFQTRPHIKETFTTYISSMDNVLAWNIKLVASAQSVEKIN